MTLVEQHLVRALDGGGASVADVGGKAAAIDRLVGHGFPVPRAVSLTADAYRAFVAGSGLAPLLDELRRARPSAPGAIEPETARVDEAFLRAPIPSPVEAAIREAARPLLSGGPVAVRSSATAEDLAAASFAGQYRTFLDVRDEDAVVEAVRLCWASLWGPSVRAYRRREGVAEEGLAMGVILMEMVPADHAGVLFTRDPQGEAGAARVEVVRGLGEALVSGRVTPDDYRVDRGTLAVRGQDVAAAPAFLEDLVRLGLRIERRLGGPQDVEWAHAAGRLVILQSRPITAAGSLEADQDGFDTEPGEGVTYTPVGVQEMLPGVLPPLLWTINAPMLDDAFRRLFADLGIPPPRAAGPYAVLGRFRGRAALNLSVLRESAATMPGGSASEVERQYLGRAIGGDGPGASRVAGGRLRRALAGLRALRVRRRVEDEVDLFSEAVEFVVALDVGLGDLPAERLLAYRARVRDLAWRGYAAEVAAAAGAAAAYRGLEIALERWVGGEAALWAQRLTAGPAAADHAGSNCAAELWELYASHARGRPPCDALLAGPGETAEERLRRLGEEGEELVSLVRRTTRHFGSKAVYGGPTWDEDAEVVWDCIRSVAACDEAGHPAAPAPRRAAAGAARREALADLRRRLRSSWRWRLTRVVTGQVVDLRSRLLRKLADDASRFLSLRERAKAALLVLGGEERRIIWEGARRLVASGLLDDPEDVLLLADGELEEMLLGGEPVSREEVARRRSALRRAEEDEPLPEVFEGVPGREALPDLTGDVLEGWAASPGRARGPARVMRSLADGAGLAAGEVIVARSTDPSWTPLFMVAGAIVLEEGGPLSHAAIVARELGLPAVLNVKGATRAIGDGDEVEVDGTRGLVARMVREDAAA